MEKTLDVPKYFLPNYQAFLCQLCEWLSVFLWSEVYFGRRLLPFSYFRSFVTYCKELCFGSPISYILSPSVCALLYTRSSSDWSCRLLVSRASVLLMSCPMPSSHVIKREGGLCLLCFHVLHYSRAWDCVLPKRFPWKDARRHLWQEGLLISASKCIPASITYLDMKGLTMPLLVIGGSQATSGNLRLPNSRSTGKPEYIHFSAAFSPSFASLRRKYHRVRQWGCTGV